MKLFCANCGVQLTVIRKAVPSAGTILDLVNPHECLAIPVDPSKVIVLATNKEGEYKFVKSLNDLPSKSIVGAIPIVEKENLARSLRPSSMTGTADLRDRRFDNKTTAPESVLDQIKTMSNSIPSNKLENDATDAEMGD